MSTREERHGLVHRSDQEVDRTVVDHLLPNLGPHVHIRLVRVGSRGDELEVHIMYLTLKD